MLNIIKKTYKKKTMLNMVKKINAIMSKKDENIGQQCKG